MNILRTCMLMDQIDHLHWLMERLGEHLPYEPREFFRTEEALNKHLDKRMAEKTTDKSYLLNWTKDYSCVDNMIESRFYDEDSIDPNDPDKEPADIHVDEGPMWFQVEQHGDLKLKNKDDFDKDDFDTDYDRFSWAAVPYWISETAHLDENVHLVGISMFNYDEDMFMQADLIDVRGLENPTNIMKVLTDFLARADENLGFIYVYDQTNAGSIKSLCKTITFDSNNTKGFKKTVKQLLKKCAESSDIELICIQSISDDDGEEGQVAVHFLVNDEGIKLLENIDDTEENKVEKTGAPVSNSCAYSVESINAKTPGNPIRAIVYALDPNRNVVALEFLDPNIPNDMFMKGKLTQFVLANKNNINVVKSGLSEKEAKELVSQLKKTSCVLEKRLTIYELSLVREGSDDEVELSVVCCVDDSNELYGYIVTENPDHALVNEEYVHKLIELNKNLSLATRRVYRSNTIASVRASEANDILFKKSIEYNAAIQ